MGIQGFFSFFKKQSDNNNNPYKFITIAQVDNSVTRLYIDFISIIYDLVVDFPDLLNNRNNGIQELLLIEVNKRLEIIVNHYPLAKIYVFFEAIPTVAKMVEQYTRKIYKKILSNIKDDLKAKLKLNFQEFDYGLISFSSQFINRLNVSINQYFTQLGREIDIDGFIPEINNIGEAEHRIISHISANLLPENNNFVIYSPDADVFVLSTILSNNLTNEIRKVNINTMRRSESIINLQTNICTREYFFVNSNKFMEYLISKITGTSKIRKRLIADILFIFNILGDDFIPIFKNFSIYDIDKLYNGYIKLPADIFILNYNETDNKFSINKDNLKSYFTQILEIDSLVNKIRYYGPGNLEKANSYFETNFYNKIVYDYLIYTFDSGLYLNEKGKGIPNRNNFGFLSLTIPYNISYKDKQVYNNDSWYFLDIIDNEKTTDTKIISLNKTNYFYVNLISLTNSPNLVQNLVQNIVQNPIPNPISNLEQILNYLEGYQFILDLYFNNYGVVSNNFWYYKYANTPTISQIINYLSNNDLPNYIVTTNPLYFTEPEYQNYLTRLVDTNYQIALDSIRRITGSTLTKIGYNDLIKLSRTKEEKTFNIIFDCEGKKYVNKCAIDGEIIESPIEFLIKNRHTTEQVLSSNLVPIKKGGGNHSHNYEQKQKKLREKYLKYKTKYLELKKSLMIDN